MLSARIILDKQKTTQNFIHSNNNLISDCLHKLSSYVDT